jgi:hypothetical protein
MNTYATDGICHNSQRGTYGHECGKPATYIAEFANGWRSGFCTRCKDWGDERHGALAWHRISTQPARFAHQDNR